MIQKNEANSHPAKFAFFYMLSLVALIFTSLSVGMVIFQVINKYIPDSIGRFGEDFSSDSLRFAIAALIVTVPLFFVISRQIYKNLFKGILSKDAGVRKWLTYFILLVSSLIVISWLIGLIINYLEGELTVKFVLKAVTAIVISAIVFTFYLYDIRREKVAGYKDKVIKVYFYGSLAIIVAVFIVALFIVESPKEARNKKLDAAVLDDFYTISNGINDYYSKNQILPDALDNLKSDVLFVTEENLKDPESGEFYGYHVVGEKRYELCATFRTSNLDNNQVYREQWPHEEGLQCIEQTTEQIEGKVIF